MIKFSAEKEATNLLQQNFFLISILISTVSGLRKKKMHKHLSHSLIKLLSEQDNRSGHSDKVGCRFCQEHCKGLVSKEQRQYVNQRNQQDDFTQACQEKRGLGIAYGNKGLLTCKLSPHKKKHSGINAEHL